MFSDQLLGIIALLSGLGLYLCFSLGVIVLFTSWIPAANALKKYMVLMVCFGLALMGLSWLAYDMVGIGKDYGTFGMLPGIILGLILLLLGMLCLFFPSVIAFRERRKYAWTLCGLNCCICFYPFNWILALVFACVQPELFDRMKARIKPKSRASQES